MLTLLSWLCAGCMTAEPPPVVGNPSVGGQRPAGNPQGTQSGQPNQAAPDGEPAQAGQDALASGGNGGTQGTVDSGHPPIAGQAPPPVVEQPPVGGAPPEEPWPPEPLPPPAERIFDAGSDPARNNIQAGGICARLAAIQCAGEAYCCDNPGRSPASCQSEMQSVCANELYLDAISLAPISGFDPTAAAAALQQLEFLASTCDTSVAQFGASATGLSTMFRGTRESGADCGPGLTTDMAAAAAALASCRDIATTACLPTSLLSWRCTPRGAAGAGCFTDINCHDGLYCPNTDFQFGVASCTPRKAVGQPCGLPNECQSLFCKGGICVEATQQAAYCLVE